MPDFKKTLMLPAFAAIILLLIVLWMAGVFDDRISPSLAQNSVADNTDVVLVIQENEPLFESVAASLEARQATVVSARIMARITEVYVRAGDTVSRGQLLLEMENDDLLSRQAQAQSVVEAAVARLTEAQANLERVTVLQAKGLLAKAELDKMRSSHDTLVAELHNARQALKEAQTAASYSQVKSPIDGRVVDRFAEPGGTAQPGAKLLSLYNPLTLRVEAQVREQLALQLKLGQSLQVEIPAQNKQLVATIEELVPAAQTGSRSFLVKASLVFDETLMPGMYARLMIPAGEIKVLLVPSDRVARVGQLDMVWVLGRNGTQARYVRLGKSRGDGQVVVISGLEVGDEVTTIPL